MSREIRMVPADWEHPKRKDFYSDCRDGESYQPLHDRDYDEEAQKWMRDYQLFLEGKHPEQESIRKWHKYYWDYDSPPDEMYCRSEAYHTKFKSASTYYQVYESVSEGTPVSPKFATEDELLKWLMSQGHSEIASRRFIKDKYVMSGLMVNGKIYSNIETLDVKL